MTFIDYAAYTQGGVIIMKCSLLADCSDMSFAEMEAATEDRALWRTMVDDMIWTVYVLVIKGFMLALYPLGMLCIKYNTIL